MDRSFSDEMLLTNRILQHPFFLERITEIEEKEKKEKRIFCLHNMEHFLAVARIMYVRNLEEKLGISADLIYSTALLHDIGRYYELNTEQTGACLDGKETKKYPSGKKTHGEMGSILAEMILRDCMMEREDLKMFLQKNGKYPQYIKDILYAIRFHGVRPGKDTPVLTTLLYEADKASRPCFSCKTRDLCNWPEKGREFNLVIKR